MHFDLTPDQKMMSDMLNSFVDNRLPDTKVLECFDAGAIDNDLWIQLSSLGIPGVMLPEAAGGAGLDLLTVALIAETCGRACMPAPVLSNALGAYVLADHDPEMAKAAAMGEKVIAFALDEGDASWTGENWRLDLATNSACKDFVVWGADADLLVVGLKGGRLGVIESDAPGVTITSFEVLDRSRPMARVTFEGARIELLCDDQDVTRRMLDALAIVLAADAYGAASHALRMAVEYSKQRHQFGKPIGSFQALQHSFANAVAELEPSRYLVWYAAHAWDIKAPDAAAAAALAKAHVTDIAVRTCRTATELHGGIGYTWNYPIHVWLKRAMADSTLLGRPQVFRRRYADLCGW